MGNDRPSASGDYVRCRDGVARPTSAFREEAYRAAEAIQERHFTSEALEGCITDFARRIIDLADAIDRLHTENALLRDVAHRAWHLLDDGGEADGDPDEFVCFRSDADRLSDALDALEATGWDAHPEVPVTTDSGRGAKVDG